MNNIVGTGVLTFFKFLRNWNIVFLTKYVVNRTYCLSKEKWNSRYRMKAK